MDWAAAMLDGGRRQAKLAEAFSWNAWEGVHKPLGRMTRSMTPGPGDRGFVSEKAGGQLRIEHRKMAFTSRRASICGGA
jgi:hypothetical protein